MQASKAQTIIAYITAGLVVFLTASAFILSYESLRLLAQQNGIEGWLSFLWPLTLDAVMIAVSMSILYRSLTGQGSWYQWFLVGFFTVASVSYNAIHAPSTWLARSVYALPPSVVFIAFELLASQVKFSVKRRGTIESLGAIQEAKTRAQAELDVLEKKADELERRNQELESKAILPEPPLKLAEPRPDKQAKQDILLATLKENPETRVKDLAAILDVSRQTVYSYLADLEAAGKLRRNGHNTVVEKEKA